MSELKHLRTFRATLREHPGLEALEKKFGTYLYLPLDVPSILPDDQERFVAWYFDRSKLVKKLRADIAGAGTAATPLFRSVNSSSYYDTIWQTNRHDVFKEFPELEARIMALPFNARPEFSIWSSIGTVWPHRDQGPWRDLPFSFRAMLYDENPKSTLYLAEVLPDQRIDKNKVFPLPRLLDTNTFAWNNLRTKHGSTYEHPHRKILLIFGNTQMNTKKLEDLYERSIAKYEQFTMKSTLGLNDFVASDASK